MCKYMGKISIHNTNTKAYSKWDDVMDTVTTIQAVGKEILFQFR